MLLCYSISCVEAALAINNSIQIVVATISLAERYLYVVRM
jgi:hypothetical protein